MVTEAAAVCLHCRRLSSARIAIATSLTIDKRSQVRLLLDTWACWRVEGRLHGLQGAVNPSRDCHVIVIELLVTAEEPVLGYVLGILAYFLSNCIRRHLFNRLVSKF